MNKPIFEISDLTFVLNSLFSCSKMLRYAP